MTHAWMWRAVAVMLVGTLSACGANPVIHDASAVDRRVPTRVQPPQRLVVFLDGTANSEGSYTNVARLRNLVTLQAREDLRTVYIEGVGADGNVLGMAMGAGIGRDVRQAYAFLLAHHRAERGDSIDLFGFSRGAYAARMLAGLLDAAGLPPAPPGRALDDWAAELYAAYKGEGDLAVRRTRVASLSGHAVTPVRVRFAGLWDSVEALGVPNYREDVVRPNPRYLDQLCNVDDIAHALSVDDDRARIFTPILLTQQQIDQQCGRGFAHRRLQQVWFAGAHSDVGGGYSDGFLSGVSLNWMLAQWRPYGLLPAGAGVVADALGPSHDPEAGLWSLLYKQLSRDLKGYAPLLPGGRLSVHQSVFERLASIAPQDHEYNWLKEWHGCFDELEDGRAMLRAGARCFDVATTPALREPELARPN